MIRSHKFSKKKELYDSSRVYASSAVATADTLFLATIAAETIPISDEEPIIFDTAPINRGGHYNTVLGAYIAPYHGYYQLVFHYNTLLGAYTAPVHGYYQ